MELRGELSSISFVSDTHNFVHDAYLECFNCSTSPPHDNLATISGVIFLRCQFLDACCS